MLGPLSISDSHGTLRLLCPDFTFGALKNGWSLALGIYADAAPTPQESALWQREAKVHFSDFLKCMEITFVCEKYLVDIRKRFFNSAKRCTNVDDLMNSITQVSKWEDAVGWPAPPAASLMRSLKEALLSSARSDFEFKEFLKALISCGDEAIIPWKGVPDFEEHTECQSPEAHKSFASDGVNNPHPVKRHPEKSRRKSLRNKVH